MVLSELKLYMVFRREGADKPDFTWSEVAAFSPFEAECIASCRWPDMGPYRAHLHPAWEDRQEALENIETHLEKACEDLTASIEESDVGKAGKALGRLKLAYYRLKTVNSKEALEMTK